MVSSLAAIAKTQPHAAHSAFTHGLTSFWSYITRTTPDICHLLQPLEDVIRTNLIPTLTDSRPPNDEVRISLLSRPGSEALL